MPLIEWDNCYSVNNVEIDTQHNKLFSLLNKLHNTYGGKLSSQERDRVIADTVKQICDYTSYHFKSEEDYMKKINYPALREHFRLHKDFSTRIFEYDYELRKDRLVFGSEIISLLKNWLLDHILVEDQKFCLFLAEEENGQKRGTGNILI